MSCVICQIADATGDVRGPGSGMIAASRAAVLTLARVAHVGGFDEVSKTLCRDHRAQLVAARSYEKRAAQQLSLVPDDLARLLRTFKAGERVVASMDIVYASQAMTVEAGRLGTVQELPAGIAPLTGACLVAWDHPQGPRAAMTTIDAIDPVAS